MIASYLVTNLTILVRIRYNDILRYHDVSMEELPTSQLYTEVKMPSRSQQDNVRGDKKSEYTTTNK